MFGEIAMIKKIPVVIMLLAVGVLATAAFARSAVVS
jgi:hypothetical protein